MSEPDTNRHFSELRSQVRRLRLISRRLSDSDVIGEFRSSFKGNGITFSELRHYSPGDDAKHIDWRATARTGSVYTKSFVEEKNLRVHIVLDISKSIFASPVSAHDVLPRAIEFSALVTLIAERARDYVGLTLFSDQVVETLPTKNSRNHYHKILQTLALPIGAEGITNIEPVLRSLNLSLKHSSLIFIISDFFCPDFSESLKILARRHDVVLVGLLPALDHSFPAVGLAYFSDAETGARFEIDLGSLKVRTWIEQELKKKEQAIWETARNSGAQVIILQSQEDTLTPLKKFLQSSHARRRAS